MPSTRWTDPRYAMASAMGVRLVAPELALWADQCYEEPSHVQFGPYRLLSPRGVQQGDPLGPAFFALAIHGEVKNARIAAELLTGSPLDWFAFYLDDGIAAGDGDVFAIFT